MKGGTGWLAKPEIHAVWQTAWSDDILIDPLSVKDQKKSLKNQKTQYSDKNRYPAGKFMHTNDCFGK
jgi:hypothetical protein